MKKIPRFFKKTRIAPTPSGYLHLGNVLSFAVTAGLADRSGARILLRIDDLDRDRVNRVYVQDIFDTLHFLEIPWDEGPRNVQEFEDVYSQIHRMGIYREALDQLKNNGNVFACACSRAQLLREGADGYSGTCRNKGLSLDAGGLSWRLRTTDEKELVIRTTSGDSLETSLPASMRDFVVRKKDGFPAYQLSSVLDDLYYGVDLIVRGEDLWPSTLAQQYLASVLQQKGFQEATFYHHPLLMASSGEKLSKSVGATSVQYLRKEGKKASDVYGLIAELMGVGGTAHNWQELAAHMLF